MHHSTDAATAVLDVKSIADDGVFSGYASLFQVRDQGGDIVLPGAFRDTLRARLARGVRLLFQHKPDEPIGIWEEIREDARGLFVRGRIATATARGREVLALMRAGAIDGLSIGFRVVSARRDPLRKVRLIAKVDLWEISVVTFPMLLGALIARVARPRMATPLARHGASLAQVVGAAARRMRERLVRPSPLTLEARSADIAGERVLLALMRAALLEQKYLDARFNAGEPPIHQQAVRDAANARLPEIKMQRPPHDHVDSPLRLSPESQLPT